jgi:hypothetical protein
MAPLRGWSPSECADPRQELVRSEQIVSPRPSENVNWPPKVADALNRLIVYENGEP